MLTEEDWQTDDWRQKRFDTHADTQTVQLIFDADFRHEAATPRDLEIRIAEEEGDVAALNAAVNAWGKVAEYTEPKLKAVEIRSDEGAVVAISRRRFDGGTDAIEAEVVEVDPVVEAIINAAVDDEDEDEE